ncbi:MAG TPA: hypothetical protein VEB42_02920 [Chitinophagaceae bacterium]|nr:hypothetical protein [Chitinophagaceae bacterium]
MTKAQFEILHKAHQVLDLLTDQANPNQRLNNRLHEAFDGLSQLIYYLEERQPAKESRWQKFTAKVKQLYFRHIVGIH